MLASCTRVDPSGHQVRNRILMRLSDTEYMKVAGGCERVVVSRNTSLMHRDAPAAHVFFPNSAVVSLVTALEDGRSVEAAQVGNEGIVGIHTALDSPVALNDALVQIGGEIHRMPTRLFRQEMRHNEELRRLITLYLQALMVQFAQTAACNRAHPLRQRACRWLLSMCDRAVADGFALTQDGMAAMLGVRRAGVTEVIRELSQAGIIVHRPGFVTILNRRALEGEACECYFIARRHFEEVFGSRCQPTDDQ